MTTESVVLVLESASMPYDAANLSSPSTHDDVEVGPDVRTGRCFSESPSPQ